MTNNINQVTITATNSRGENAVHTLMLGAEGAEGANQYVGKRSLKTFLDNLKNLFDTKANVDAKLETKTGVTVKTWTSTDV